MKVNMLVNVFFVLFLLGAQKTVWSVRLVELRVPAHEREGGMALLECNYDLEGDVLYSVKWYKDEKEFYRYVPKNSPPIIFFKRPGINVNKSRSSSTVVALENLTRESEGEYSCEVSGEGPNFTTTLSHKRINIHLLPETGPTMTGIQERYFPGEIAVINCSSSPSRPKAALSWLINGEAAPESYLIGPWYLRSYERPDAIETVLQLRFVVTHMHFVDGAMVLKCQSTIAPLYQRVTKSTHYIALPFHDPITERTIIFDFDDEDDATDSSHQHSSKYMLIFTTLLFYAMAVII